MNELYYGDNLDVLKRYVADESVDLIYLDPPFNSNSNYNVLFAERDGTRAAAQIKAFEDTWRWDEGAARSYQEVVEGGGDVSRAMQAFRTLLGESDMLAYLAMMAPRLVELRRVLKPKGTLYLHCDPTASHYLKLLLDAVFGARYFRNEITWRRSNPKSLSTTNFPNCRDVILRYTKTDTYTFNKLYGDHDPAYVKKAYRHQDAGGWYRLLPLLNPNDNRPNLTYEFLGVTRVWRWTRKRMQQAYDDGLVVQLKPGAVPQYKKYIQDSLGRTITNDWQDIEQVAGAEALGYPTQKPRALLDRIVNASSNPGDVILDPFCGCGTTIDAAQFLNRQWIGIDLTHLAITLIRQRLKDTYGAAVTETYKVIGEPVSPTDAQELAETNPYQFQWWALGLIGARPTEGKKGADKGIDGRIYFHEGSGPTRQIVISVKAGALHAPYVRDLRGVLEREDAEIGVLLTMNEPTKAMRTEAASAGFYTSLWGQHSRLQIVTVGELLDGHKLDVPPMGQTSVTFKRAPRARQKAATTQPLDIGGE